jgi:cellulose synthase/poly-beta-1,6-N-acetylglucosamine synthase-like glycosyltransferase
LNGTLSVVLWLLAGVLVAPALVFCLQCLAALLSGRSARPTAARAAAVTDDPSAAPSRPRVAVLIPAHNEHETLAASLDAVRPQLRDGDLLVVVADNCDDDTAAIARERGATVIERADAEHRGKGYALSHGLGTLSDKAFDVLIVLDADCRAEDGSVDALARQVTRTGKPAQAVYLMEACHDPTPRDRVSSWAFMVKNLVRPIGLAGVGMPVPLTGTGMAFPRAALAKVSLGSGNIVEDMQLGLDLALAGDAPRLCPQARVTGRFPRDGSTALGQRRRWEHGHLRTIIGQVPRLLWRGVTRGRLGAVAMALDLLVPPLSLLIVLLILASLAAALVALLTPVTWAPAIVLASSLVAVLACVFLAWLKFGRATLPPRSLAAAITYVAWKLPMYCMFLIRPEKRWVRTARTPESAPPAGNRIPTAPAKSPA